MVTTRLYLLVEQDLAKSTRRRRLDHMFLIFCRNQPRGLADAVPGHCSNTALKPSCSASGEIEVAQQAN
jgi:hypothetical protein